MDEQNKIFGRKAFGAITALNPSGKGAKIRRRKPAKPNLARMISIIVPAHNEEDYLGLTLDAMNRQNYPHFEIIVVANGCTDCTAEVARNSCHRLVVLSDKGLGLARNLGAKLARGELLIFLDADTLLEPGALETIAYKFTHVHAAGTCKGRPNSDRLAFRLIYGLKNFMHYSSLHRGSSGVIVCWKKDFITTHGFDEALQVRENSDLIERLRHFGKYRYIGETAAMTSMRRYENVGTGKMLSFWFRLWLQSLFCDLRHKDYVTIR